MKQSLLSVTLLVWIIGACNDATSPTALDSSPERTLRRSEIVAETPASVATVTTDKDDYLPGETVTITGTGWEPGEVVRIVIDEDPETHNTHNFSAVADDAGDFVHSEFEIEEHDLGVTFFLTATGMSSGRVASTSFTDGNITGAVLSIREGTCTTNTAVFVAGASVCAHVTFSVSGSGPTSFSVRWFKDGSITATPSASISGNPLTSPRTNVQTPAAGSWEVKVCTNTGGTCNQQGSSAFFTVTAPGPAPTTTMITSSNNPSDFGESVTFEATVSSGGGTPTGDVTFKSGASCAAGTTLNGPTALDGGGQASFMISSLTAAASPHTIWACYAGNASFAASDDDLSQVVNAAPTTTVVTVAPTSQQYSDKVELNATVSPASLEGEDATGSIEFFIDGSSVGSAVVSMGAAALAAPVQILLAAGDYDVKAQFTSTNGNFASSPLSDAKTLTVTKENASVDYAAANPGSILVAVPGGTSGVFNLAISVRETNPESNAGPLAMAGDINNAGLAVSLKPIGGGSSIAGLCSSMMAGVGYTTKPFSCQFNSVPVETYTVDVQVTGDYYVGGTEDVLTVYDPSLGFITGGGSYYWYGERVTFGFTVKANKKGSNGQGNIVIIRHTADGMVYRAKSNVISPPAISGNTATFSGKMTYIEPGWASSIGNNSFSAYVQDNGEPGSSDKFWVSIAGGPGLTIPAPAAVNAKTLAGGNIQVPHSP